MSILTSQTGCANNAQPQSMDVSNSGKAYKILRDKINQNAEELWVMGFNSQMHVVCHELIFRGTANNCPFHPRDLFRTLILSNSCSYLIWHNHPSNSCLPSGPDITLTRKLIHLSKMMQIPLVDHLIVTTLNFVSLAEMGIFKGKRSAY